MKWSISNCADPGLRKKIQLTAPFLKGVMLLMGLSLMLNASANHLKGGWIQYEYMGPGAAGKSVYRITVRQYLDCSSTAVQRDQNVYLGIFDAVTGIEAVNTITIPLSGSDNPNKLNFSECLNNPPVGKVCYFVDRYVTSIELPNNPNGYILAVQRCCRIANIVNIGPGSSKIGVTYSNKIPGTISGIDYSNNSSAFFSMKDTAVICYNSPFTFDFSATDIDGDSLRYHFGDGLTGGTANIPQPNPPSNPPYSNFAYAPGYSGSSPMGPTVSIDPTTGIISGIAPGTIGDYVIAVFADEYRKGILIGSTRKEIHITVADCSLSAAALKPSYITCDGYTMSFQNESPNSTVSGYLWTFGESKYPATNSSTQPTPVHNYKDTGTYNLKLVVTSSGGCKDSASALVGIYPGFVPDFTISGTCFENPYQFLDKSVTKYGVINSWHWDFGDLSTFSDTASSKDSAWKYQNPQTVQVSLIVSNSKGCIDTLTKPFIIRDKPSLNLAFKDTLICSIDTLKLNATISSGTILWTPDNQANKLRILNANTTQPLVFPKDSTRYIVHLTDNGCINSDTVQVNVLSYISVDAGLDSNICQTDTFRLHPQSQALSYAWKSSTGEVVANIKNPLVQPLVNTKYYVTANLGKCQAKDSVSFAVSPYPKVAVSPDTTLCYGTRILLQGRALADLFSWSPTNTLINAGTLSPTAGPTQSTAYVLSVRNITGCLKTVSDTIHVTVIPMLHADAGNDTTIIADQPVQLNASGGVNYQWTPSTGLSDPTIANPIVTLPSSVDSITYRVTVSDTNGCKATDLIKVRVFQSNPEIFVPTAFTPDGDGRNDILKPLTVGIVKLNYFAIYNRWGQQMFQTTELNKGWDGTLNGIAQPAGTYVYAGEAIDYTGALLFRKGTVVLIR